MKDYGGAIYSFMSDIQNKGFEIVLILGEPGTGKSSGMRTLPHESNIWYNTDNKNPVWEGGRAEYGKKSSPIAPYHLIPTSYKEIIDHIDIGIKVIYTHIILWMYSLVVLTGVNLMITVQATITMYPS